MSDGETPDQPQLFPTKVGERLREMRIAQGLALSDIAARTRITLRHLDVIEASDYSVLPSTTYAMGFVRAYARVVGADEVAIARDLRVELATGYTRTSRPVNDIADDEPRRTPNGMLAMIALAVALVLMVGVGLWYGTSLFRAADPVVAIDPDLNPEPTPAPSATMPLPPVAGGQVSLIATDKVWVRVNDADGKRLFEKELAAGERYDVPPDAKGPTINTGRPDKLTVTVNGSQVAPLGTGEIAISGVAISADALQARTAGGVPLSVPTPVPTPAARRSTARTAATPRPQPTLAPTPAPPAPVASGTPTP